MNSSIQQVDSAVQHRARLTSAARENAEGAIEIVAISAGEGNHWVFS